MLLVVFVRCSFTLTSFFVSHSCFRAARTLERIFLLINRIRSGAYFALAYFGSRWQASMFDFWMSIWSSWQKLKKVTSDFCLGLKVRLFVFRILDGGIIGSTASLLMTSENDNGKPWMMRYQPVNMPQLHPDAVDWHVTAVRFFLVVIVEFLRLSSWDPWKSHPSLNSGYLLIPSLPLTLPP